MMIAVPTICGPLILTDRRVSTFKSSLVGAPRESIEDRLLGHVDVGGRMVDFELVAHDTPLTGEASFVWSA